MSIYKLKCQYCPQYYQHNNKFIEDYKNSFFFENISRETIMFIILINTRIYLQNCTFMCYEY